MKPEIVVFDIGGVLIDWSPHHLYRRLIPDEDARAALFARLPLDAMNLEGDRNGSLRAEVEALAERHLEEAALILPWWVEWERMCAGLFEEMVALRDALRASGVPVWALSNFAADAWERVLSLYPELGAFDGLVISGHERLVKPDPALYERLERRAGAAGPSLFFIDDRDCNVSAARARRWGGHVHDGATGTRAALAAAGLPV